MALVSDESTDDACEWFSGLIVGVGVSILLEVPVIGLTPIDEVVAVGAAGPWAATFTVAGTLVTPSNLCNGSKDHPSGIVTPGGRSALPAGIAAVFDRAPCRCI